MQYIMCESTCIWGIAVDGKYEVSSIYLTDFHTIHIFTILGILHNNNVIRWGKEDIAQNQTQRYVG